MRARPCSPWSWPGSPRSPSIASGAAWRWALTPPAPLPLRSWPSEGHPLAHGSGSPSSSLRARRFSLWDWRWHGAPEPPPASTSRQRPSSPRRRPRLWSTGGDDLPVRGLMLLAVVLAGQERPVGAGIALGIAAATKQTAWILVPFLVAAVALANDRRTAAKLAGAAAAVVLPVIAAFAAWN